MKGVFSLVKISSLLLAVILLFTACSITGITTSTEINKGSSDGYEFDDSLPLFEHRNNGVPYFTESEITSAAYEKYSPLDSLGRCGVAIACIGKEIMPSDGEKRGEIDSVKPSGWCQAKYDM